MKLEADYDKFMKESQSKTGITVRWDHGLSGRRVAFFMFPKEDDGGRMMAGDEMRLRLPGDSSRPPWEAMGHVVRAHCDKACLRFLVEWRASLA